MTWRDECSALQPKHLTLLIQQSSSSNSMLPQYAVRCNTAAFASQLVAAAGVVSAVQQRTQLADDVEQLRRILLILGPDFCRITKAIAYITVMCIQGHTH